MRYFLYLMYFFSLLLVVGACNQSPGQQTMDTPTPIATNVHLSDPTPTSVPTASAIPKTVVPTEALVPSPTPPEEVTSLIECVSYDPAELQISSIGDLGWELSYGYIRIAVLDNVADAHNAFELAKQYSQRCSIGREFSDHYYMQFWKGESNVYGEERDWDCVSYIPENLSIEAGSNLWTITDDGHKLQSFGSEIAAEEGLKIAMDHTKVCYIGRANQRENRWEYIISYWK